jgi:hypothetical protein
MDTKHPIIEKIKKLLALDNSSNEQDGCRARLAFLPFI